MSTSQLAVTSIATKKKKKVNTVDGLTSFYFFFIFFRDSSFLNNPTKSKVIIYHLLPQPNDEFKYIWI